MTWHATVHDRLDGLEPLAGAWDELAEAAGRPCSLSRWMTAWARHPGAGGALRVAVVCEGDEVVGILPGVVVRDRAGVRRWRLLGAGTTTTIEPLARRGYEIEVAHRAAAALAATRPRIDLVAFEGIPADSPWPQAVARGWPGARPGLLRPGLSVPEPLVRLDAPSFDEWFAGRSSNFRGQLRRARRTLAKGGGEVRRTDRATLDADLAAFVRLHGARWAGRGGSGVVGPRVVAMLAEACPPLLEQDRLDLWCVETEGKVVGAQLWLRAGGVTSMWLSGSDDEHAAVRPAMLLMAAAVQDGFERGLSTVSFGSGGQDYKRRFSDPEEDAIRWWALPVPGPRLGLALARVEAIRARRELGLRLGDERKARLNQLRRSLRP